MGGLWRRRRRLLCSRNLSITACAWVFSTIFCQVGIAFFSVLASLREFVRLFLAFEFVAYTRLVTLSSSSPCLNAQCSWYRNRTERQIDNVCPRLKFQRANRTLFHLKRDVMGVMKRVLQYVQCPKTLFPSSKSIDINTGEASRMTPHRLVVCYHYQQ